jgi:hypothetical protein
MRMAPVVLAMLVSITLAGAANAAGTPERGNGSPRRETGSGVTAKQPGARRTTVRIPLPRSAQGRGSVARQPSRRSNQPTLPGRAGSNAVLRGQEPPSPVRRPALTASTIRARAMLDPRAVGGRGVTIGGPHASRTTVLGGPANARTVLTSTVDGTAQRRRF